MLIEWQSPSGSMFYTCLPICVTQLAVLMTIKHHIDLGDTVGHIYDLSETFEDDEFVATLDNL